MGTDQMRADAALWDLGESEKARRKAKRERALGLLERVRAATGARGVIALIGSGEASEAPARFTPNPWALDLGGLCEPKSALLLCSEDLSGALPTLGGASREAMLCQGASFEEERWEGWRMGWDRSLDCLGLPGASHSELQPALALFAAAGFALALDPRDESEPARMAQRIWREARARGRERLGSPSAWLWDLSQILLPLRMIIDETERAWARASCDIAAMGHIASLEALFRGIAITRDAKGAQAALRAGAPVGAAFPLGAQDLSAPAWQARLARGPLGPLGQAMAAAGLHAALSERALEAAFLATTLNLGASGPAYAPICASGPNACCLHWTQNDRLIQEGDWALLDMGCVFQGFHSDITRSAPASGAFTGVRGDLYRGLLDAQRAAIGQAREGGSFEGIQATARALMASSLASLGLAREAWLTPEAKEKAQAAGLPLAEACAGALMGHSISHFLGRETHDVGLMAAEGEAPFELIAGMRITVEPGLYFPAHLPGLPAELQGGFGLRIEDDCLILPAGAEPEVLSERAPKACAEIEAIAKSCGL